MNNLPIDIIQEISFFLHASELTLFLSTCSKFWKLRQIKWFLSRIDCYKKALVEHNYSLGLGEAMERSNEVQTEYFMEKLERLITPKSKRLVLLDSIANGHEKLMHFCIQNGADNWNRAMEAAAEKGRKDLVHYFAEKGGNSWNEVLICAVKQYDKELIEESMQRGARVVDYAMACAGKHGHKDLVDYFALRGGRSWGQVMVSATKQNDMEWVEKCIQHGGGKWNKCLLAATKRRNLDMIRLFAEQAYKLNEAISNVACKTETDEMIIKVLLEYGASYNAAINRAIECGNFKLTHFLLSQYGQDKTIQIQFQRYKDFTTDDLKIINHVACNYFEQVAPEDWEDVMISLCGCTLHAELVLLLEKNLSEVLIIDYRRALEQAKLSQDKMLIPHFGQKMAERDVTQARMTGKSIPLVLSEENKKYNMDLFIKFFEDTEAEYGEAESVSKTMHAKHRYNHTKARKKQEEMDHRNHRATSKQERKASFCKRREEKAFLRDRTHRNELFEDFE